MSLLCRDWGLKFYGFLGVFALLVVPLRRALQLVFRSSEFPVRECTAEFDLVPSQGVLQQKKSKTRILNHGLTVVALKSAHAKDSRRLWRLTKTG
jgi:hypothetical protein